MQACYCWEHVQGVVFSRAMLGAHLGKARHDTESVLQDVVPVSLTGCPVCVSDLARQSSSQTIGDCT